MLTKRYAFTLLGIFALFAGALAIRPVFDAPSVHAQSPRSNYFIEPGTTSIRPLDGSGETPGKMVIDLETGDVWGFPTSPSAYPYPVDPLKHDAPVSKPIYLGKFDFAAMRRP